MQINYLAYHGLIVLSIILSFVAIYNGHKRYFPLLLVLISTELVEIIAQFAVLKGDVDFVWAYHVFVVVEYSLFALYLRFAINLLKVKKIILITIPLFVAFSLFISYSFYRFHQFPGININTEGFLLFIFSIILLFNLDVVENESIFSNPDVWISLGILIFEGGTFLCNGVYTKLLSLDQNKAHELFNLINKPLNICFYTFINIGLVCLIKKKRFTIQ